MADNGEWQTNVNDRKQGKINNGKWLTIRYDRQ